MAADGSVIIEILGDAKEFTKTLTGIAGGAVKTLTAAIAGVSTAISGVAAAAIKVGSGFEQSMSQVAATMGLSVEEIQNGSSEFELLSQAAKDAGATTAFSASEAADALNYLALAGYDAQTSADVLPSVLNLAAAGGMELAYASDLATDAMSALGIEANKSNLETFGDQMARTASKSNTSVAQLGEAILTVGGTAKSLAGGTVELNAALGVLANRGIKGAEGGTALRNIIQSLSGTSGHAAKMLKSLGVSAYDSDGKMRPLNETFKDLNSALEGMTDQEKTNALGEIFNKFDLKSARALLAGTGAEFDALADAIANSEGAMQNMADVQLDNLNGDITILKSGLEGLGIALYETMQVNARGAVQSITSAVGEISAALSEGGLPAAIEVAGQQIAGFATSIAKQAPAVISSAVSLIQSFLQGIRDNLPSLVEAALDIVSSLTNGIMQIAPNLASTGVQIFLALADGIISAIPQIASQLPQIITGIANFITENLPILTQKGIELLNALADGMFSDIPGLISVILDALLAISESILENAGLLIDAGIEIIKNLAQGIIESIPTLIEKVPTIVSNIANVINENAPKLLSAGIEIISQLILGLISAIPTLVKNIPKITVAIWNVVTAVNWMSLGKTIITGLGNGIKGMVGFAKTSIGTVKTAIHDGIRTLPQTFLQIGKNIIQGLINGIKNMAGAAVQAVKNVGASIVSGITDFFDIRSPSRVMRDQVGMMIGGGLAIGIENSVNSVEKSTKKVGGMILNQFDQINGELEQQIAEKEISANPEFLDRIPETVDQLPEELKPIGEQAVQGLIEGMNNMSGEAVSAAQQIKNGILKEFESISAELSSKLKAASDSQSARITENLTISANAPVEARRATDTRRAAENASANAAFGGGTQSHDNSTFVLNIGAKEFYRGTLSDLRAVEDASPRVRDD